VKPPRAIETIRIDSLAAGGAGIGKLARGLVVFVPQAAPDDLVEVEVDTRVLPAQARVLRLVEPSPERVEPPCPFVVTCGGCDWMHLAESAQQKHHAAIVTSALAHAAKGAQIPLARVHPAPATLGYRTRARLFARSERSRLRVGYRAANSRALAEVDACLVLDLSVAPLLGEIPKVLAGARGEGDVLIGRGKGGLPVLELAWKGELPATTWAALDERVRTSTLAGARVVLAGVANPATFGDPRPVIEGADGAPLVIAPGGFAQPSDLGAAALAGRVAELAALTAGPEGSEPVWKETKPRHVVELFAGSGTLSVLLARGAASFTAVEIDPEGCAAARENLASRGLTGKVSPLDADAFAIPPKTEVVVLDPPRAGAPGAMRAIAASSARAVVYVSCDPPTLARDLGALLRSGFALTHLETFELFPQTSHVETVARAVRVRPKGARG
jgi:23S rRNA (uracil1939-C5)-methyltransferase